MSLPPEVLAVVAEGAIVVRKLVHLSMVHRVRRCSSEARIAPATAVVQVRLPLEQVLAPWFALESKELRRVCSCVQERHLRGRRIPA